MTAGASPRRFLIGFFAALALVVAAIASFNYAVDPFHYYHGLTAINHVFFPGFQRYQNVGLARSFKYDTVVVGSSVTENFLPSYIERSWGGRAMKLSISGSTSHEQYLILQQAVATGQLRRVIWGLDVSAFYGGAERVRDDQGRFPYFMYRRPALFNIEYPLALSTLSLSLRVVRGWGETDLDDLDTWYKGARYGEAAVVKGWSGTCGPAAAKYQPGRFAPPPEAIREMREAVRRNLLAPVRDNPRIVFYLFLPPMARLIYLPAANGLLTYSLPLRDYVAQTLAGLPNVRLFDFQTMSPLNDDLARYKDPLHFDLATSEYLIDAMREGSGRVGRARLLADNAALIDQVNKYDFCRVHGPLAKRN